MCVPISLVTELLYTKISKSFYITNLRKIRDRINKNISQRYRSNTTSFTQACKILVKNGSNNTDHNCTHIRNIIYIHYITLLLQTHNHSWPSKGQIRVPNETITLMLIF
jgi:hypothetical protein